MSPNKPKLTAFLLILALAVPLFLVPSGAAPAVGASQGDITTAGDAVAGKIHSKLQAAVADSASGEAFDIIVYAAPGTDLSKYMSDLVVQKYVLPNGTQTHFGRATAAQVGKLASLPGVAAIQDMRYAGEAARDSGAWRQAPGGHCRSVPGPRAYRSAEGPGRPGNRQGGCRPRGRRRLVRRSRRPQVQGSLGSGLHRRGREGHGQ